jgi:aspartate/methionine/tyrosine aminotransferase
MDSSWRMDLSQINDADAEKALCIWVNSPGNPAGAIEDLDAAAAWGRARGIPVISDECYISFTWDGPGRSILSNGTEGLIAVHSLSKRSNFAGARAGFYAGDNELLHYISEVRKHAGFMPPGPSQAAAVVAFGDEAEVQTQRARYIERMEYMRETLSQLGIRCELPQGGFYLWVPAPDGDAWAFVERLANDLGLLVAPGEFYGSAAPGYVRMAMVTPMESLELVRSRIG